MCVKENEMRILLDLIFMSVKRLCFCFFLLSLRILDLSFYGLFGC
jgi:hypothetical protein